ncbi:Hypothetical protein CINCED_3A022909 [Cinara cedri]|uniref:Uncharacterized protein n=1 Tax=Cinara cedri TaxID=506608 RepID=A0A5E4NEJ9_9HEMI|nr:Hypothetical protein CINCED_3A022909 [Cinara cedri]
MSKNRRLTVPVKCLIPKSRLVAAVGGKLLRGSDPAVCEGDDVYEVNLTVTDNSDSGVRVETWMSLETEHAFLRCIVGGDADGVEHLIAYATKNHWLGGKNIRLNLDVDETIINRQSKLVLYNSKPQKSLDYHVSNASKPSKKTDFILEEWPYVSFNRPLIPKGHEDEFAPWLRTRNKRFNEVHRPKSRVSSKSQKPCGVSPRSASTPSMDQRSRSLMNIDRLIQQHHQQHQQQQKIHNILLLQKMQQATNFFVTSPPLRTFGQRPPMIPYNMSNFAYHLSPGDLYHPFPTPPPPHLR